MVIKMESKENKPAKKSLHAGHRQRVISKFTEYGLDTFAEHEVLELILFFSIARADTNPLAHVLLDKFGNLENVLNADPKDLMEVSGVGGNTAALISLIRSVNEYKNTKLYDKKVIFRNSYGYGTFCVKYFSDHVNEESIMLSVDTSMRLKAVTCISKGTSSRTAFDSAKMLKTALTFNAPGVIIAHNHPGGEPQPSVADLALTRKAYEMFESVDIKLIDHVICNEKYFTSLKERGLFEDFNKGRL